MPTLIDEVVSRIRGTMAGPLSDDGTDAGCKVWGDFVPPESLPWVVVHETGESYTFMSRTQSGVSYLADGQLQIDVFAADRRSARDLGVEIAYTLDDAEYAINPAEGRLTMIRCTSARFVPLPEVAPGSASVFQRSLTIQYQQQRTI